MYALRVEERFQNPFEEEFFRRIGDVGLFNKSETIELIRNEFRKLGVEDEVLVDYDKYIVHPQSFYSFMLFQGYDIPSCKKSTSPVTDGVWIYSYNGIYLKVAFSETRAYKIPESCRIGWKRKSSLAKLFERKVVELLA